MKKQFLLCLLFSLVVFPAVAQEDVFTVQPGEKFADAIPDAARYYLPRYEKCQVAMKDGRSGTLLLNYNFLFEEMMFVDAKGDTVSVISPGEFKYFVLGKDTFFFDKMYLRDIGTYGDYRLAVRTYFDVSDVKKQGPLGGTTSVGIDVMRRTDATDNFGPRELVAREVTTVKKYRLYFVGNEANGFERATKKNILRLYRKKSEQIRSYINDNHINYNKEEDLVKLLSRVK